MLKLVRRIDDLGRVVIPREVREYMFGKCDTTGIQVEFSVIDNQVVLQKSENYEKSCEQKIREQVIDEFAQRVIAEYHQLPTTLGFTEQIVNEIADQMKQKV